jgi:hypothetical protein
MTSVNLLHAVMGKRKIIFRAASKLGSYSLTGNSWKKIK